MTIRQQYLSQGSAHYFYVSQRPPTFFHLRTPWQPISTNCTVHIIELFVINIIAIISNLCVVTVNCNCWRMCPFPPLLILFSRTPGGTRAPGWDHLCKWSDFLKTNCREAEKPVTCIYIYQLCKSSWDENCSICKKFSFVFVEFLLFCFIN